MQASVHEAKTHLSKLIEAALKGEHVVITRHGEAVVEVIPARKKRVTFGSLAGLVGEPPEDLFDPLSEEELRDWEGA